MKKLLLVLSLFAAQSAMANYYVCTYDEVELGDARLEITTDDPKTASVLFVDPEDSFRKTCDKVGTGNVNMRTGEVKEPSIVCTEQDGDDTLINTIKIDGTNSELIYTVVDVSGTEVGKLNFPMNCTQPEE